MKTISITLFLFAALASAHVFSQNYITSPTSDYSFLSTEGLCNNSVLDSVFVFCSENPSAGILSAPNSGCTYTWYAFNYVTGLFDLLPYTTQEVAGLSTGGYRVETFCSGVNNCYGAWVFVNSTEINVSIGSTGSGTNESVYEGCSAYSVTGEANALASFSVHTGIDDFIIGPDTYIKVCFSADHTWVSDLGFYLVAPGFGLGWPNPSIPGSYGTIELLPSVAAWSNVTSLNSSILGCSLPTEINTNCSNGDDAQDFCFTTSLPSGMPAYVPCVCDLSNNSPLTGTWASAGPWNNIYGFSTGFGGWSVQVYDCIGADVGHISEVSLLFIDSSQAVPKVNEYLSGPIVAPINDMSCDYSTASGYSFSDTTFYPNYITDQYWTIGLDGPMYASEDFYVPTPSDEPITYYFHAFDNFGCEKTDSVVYIPSFFDPSIITQGASLCQTDEPIVMESLNQGGTWIGNGIINGTFDPSANDVQYGPQGNLIQYYSTGTCEIFDSVIFFVEQPLSITNLHDTCSSNNNTYFLNFDVLGGQGPYSVLNSATGLTAGTIWGNTFFSYGIASGESYSYYISSAGNCGSLLFEGTNTCLCSNNAGSMSLTPLTACQGETITAVHGGDQYLLANNIFEFIIHDGTGVFPHTPLAWSSNGAFDNTDIPGLVYGQTYYIAAACSPEDSGNPGHTNPSATCYNQSAGMPVVWFQTPQANAGPDDAVCSHIVQLNAEIPLIGDGQWTNATIPFSFANMTGANNNDAFVEVAETGSWQFEWTVHNGACFSSDWVTISFADQVIANVGEDIQYCGQTGQLIATEPDSGISGLWSGIGVLNNPTSATCGVSVNNYGNYIFFWTVSSSSCSDVDSVELSFISNDIPIISTSTIVCGNSQQLSVSPVSQGIWSWSGDALSVSFLPNINSSNAMAVVESTENLSHLAFTWTSISDSLVQCVSTVTANVYFLLQPSPNAGQDDSICGLTYLLHGSTPLQGFTTNWTIANGIPGSNYWWNPISHNYPQNSVNVSQYGSYSFVWNEYNPINSFCYGSDTVVINFVNCSNILTSSGNITKAKVYPNPGNGLYMLEMSGVSDEILTLEVTDLQGRLVLANKIMSQRGNVAENIDISSCSKGVYLLSIAGSFEKHYIKLVVE